ncbi:MAG: hypothetical protein ACREO2_09625 [Arenimonas sp.]
MQTCNRFCVSEYQNLFLPSSDSIGSVVNTSSSLAFSGSGILPISGLVIKDSQVISGVLIVAHEASKSGNNASQ